MAKSIVLGLLMETLGEFVDISRENMKMAVWSGQIEMKDLRLKADALASLDLPISVLHGLLESVKVTIPWTSLGKSSTTIQLDGLIAFIGPAQDDKFTAEDLRRHSSELKRKILERAEKIAFAYVSGELRKKEMGQATSTFAKKKLKSNSWSSSIAVSYVQGLVAKVLANIEFKFRNIHVRYEDSVAMPGRLISAGVTLDEILIVTTNKDWVETIVVNKVSNAKKTSGTTPVPPITYKIATVKNLAVYWNIDSPGPIKEGSGRNSETQWLAAMKSLIYSQSNELRSRSTTQYILTPPNLIVVKFAHDSSKPSARSAERAYDNAAEGINHNQIGSGTISVTDTAHPDKANNKDTTNIINSNNNNNNSSSKDSSLCLADISIDFGCMSFAANVNQLNQVIAVLDSFRVVQRQRHLFLFRPTERPTKNPRAWWIYAYKLLTGRDDILYNKAETIRLCVQCKKRYKQLVAMSVTRPATPLLNFLLGFESGQGSGSGVGSGGVLESPPGLEWQRYLRESSGGISLPAAEGKEMLKFEQMLPLQALIAYRQQAVTETLLAAYAKSCSITETEVTRAVTSATSAVSGMKSADGVVSEKQKEKERSGQLGRSSSSVASSTKMMQSSTKRLSSKDINSEKDEKGGKVSSKKSIGAMLKSVFNLKSKDKDKEKEKEKERDKEKMGEEEKDKERKEKKIVESETIKRDVLKVKSTSLKDMSNGTDNQNYNEDDIDGDKVGRSVSGTDNLNSARSGSGGTGEGGEGGERGGDEKRSNNSKALKLLNRIFGIKNINSSTSFSASTLPLSESSDDVSVEYLTNELLSDIGCVGSGEGVVFTLLRLKVSASVSVRLSDVTPLADVQVVWGGNMTVTSATDICVGCFVSELKVQDLVTVTPVKGTLLSFAVQTPSNMSMPSSSTPHTSRTPTPAAGAGAGALMVESVSADSNILKCNQLSGRMLTSSAALSEENTESNLNTDPGSEPNRCGISVVYESTSKGKSSLRAHCQPLEVVLNVLCLERLSDLIAARAAGLLKVVSAFDENDYLRKSAEWGAEGVITAHTGADMAAQVAAAIAGDSLNIAVEVSSNKIVLPMSGSSDDGCFVLDLGKAALHGSYNAANGLSLVLEVQDLCAGIIPTGGKSIFVSERDMGYVLQPIDAHLSFRVPGTDRDCVGVGVGVGVGASPSQRHQSTSLTLSTSTPTSTPTPTPVSTSITAPATSTDSLLPSPPSSSSSSSSSSHPSSSSSSSSSSHPSSSSCHSSAADLLINLDIKSELQFALTPLKLVQIVRYSRIFIKFVWTINDIFTSHLGESAKYITDEKLTQGLHFLNNVLNPNTKGKNATAGLKTSTRIPPTSFLPITRGKKGTFKMSKMFSKIIHNISGSVPLGIMDQNSGITPHRGIDSSRSALQSLGLNINKHRIAMPDPFQLNVEVHLAVPSFLLEIVCCEGEVGGDKRDNCSGSSKGDSMDDTDSRSSSMNAKKIRLLLSTMSLDILQRAYDTRIAVSVGALSLDDSSRPTKQRYLMLSKNLNSEAEPISVGVGVSKGSDSSDSNNTQAEQQRTEGNSPLMGGSMNSNAKATTSACVRREPGSESSPDSSAFASIHVLQIFDSLSPFKATMDSDVDKALNNRVRAGRGGDEVVTVRELDESLLIKTIGLALSVDASAVRQVREIVEPAFACIFSSPVATAVDHFLTPREESIKIPTSSETDSHARGHLIGCLEGRDWEAEREKERGRDRGGGTNEAQSMRVLIRALLKLDLEVGCITVDMLKAAELQDSRGELESVCRLDLTLGVFQAMILDNRIAQAHVAMMDAALFDTRNTSRGWHYRTLLSRHSIQSTIPSMERDSRLVDKEWNGNGKGKGKGKRAQEEKVKHFAIPQLAGGSNFLDVNIYSPHDDAVEVELFIQHALAVIAVDTVKDICAVAMIIAYDLLTTVKTAQYHVEDAADRFSAAIRASNGATNTAAIRRSGMSSIEECEEVTNSSPSDSHPNTPLPNTPIAMASKSVSIHVTVGTAYLVVLEDPSREDSASFMLTLEVDAQMSEDQWGAQSRAQGQVQDSLQVQRERNGQGERQEEGEGLGEGKGVRQGKEQGGIQRQGRGRGQGEEDESQEAVHVSLRGVQVFVLPDTGLWLMCRSGVMHLNCAPSFTYACQSACAMKDSDWTPSLGLKSSTVSAAFAVCDPFSTDFHLTRCVVKGIPLATNASVNVGDINATVSLPHLSLARSIMLRASLSGLSTSKNVSLDYHCVFGDLRGDGVVQVDIYLIALNIAKISITAIDDMVLTRTDPGGEGVAGSGLRRGEVGRVGSVAGVGTGDSSGRVGSNYTPLVRVQLLSLHLDADGVLNPKMYVNSRTVRSTLEVLNLEGRGRIAVGADFFNPVVRCWEPLVEHWGVVLTMTKAEQGLSCTVSDDYVPLQVNISGRFLDVMISAYATWVRKESEKKATHPIARHHSRSNSVAGRSRRDTISSPSALPSHLLSPPSSSLSPPFSSLSPPFSSLSPPSSIVGEYEDATGFSIPPHVFQEQRQKQKQGNTQDGGQEDNLNSSSDSPLLSLSNVEKFISKGPYLVLHNMLLCDLYYRLIELNTDPPSSSSSSSSTPQLPSSSMQFSNLFSFTSQEPPVYNDTYDSSDEAVLTAGCSITLPVDTAIRSHNLLVRVGPYDWSAVPLHTDEDKKSTIDFYQRSYSRTNGGGGGVETESAIPRSIKLSLRSHSTSHPIDTDAVPLSPSFMMGPTVVVKVVTDVVLFSEGAFVDRSGLRLKLRASRRGVNVERHAWKEAVKGVDEEETSGYYKQDTEMTQGQRQGGGEDVTDMPSPALEEPYLSFAIAGRLLHRTLCTDSRNSAELQSNSTSDTGLNDTSRSTRDKAEHTNFSGKQGSFSTSDINISPPHTAPLSLLNFAVRSCREYRVVDRLVEGQRVYTDRPNLTWIHLPSVLRNQLFVSTPCDDCAAKDRGLVRFHVSKPALTIVLTNASTRSRPPSWLHREGFKMLTVTAVARYGRLEPKHCKEGKGSSTEFSGKGPTVIKTPGGGGVGPGTGSGSGMGSVVDGGIGQGVGVDSYVNAEQHYICWGKVVTPSLVEANVRDGGGVRGGVDRVEVLEGEDDQEVVLSGAEAKGASSHMYAVCVVDISSLDPLDDITMDILGQSGSQLGSSSSLPLVKEMWAEGGEGITMFHSSDDRLSITRDDHSDVFGKRENSVFEWSDDISTSYRGSHKTLVEIVNKSTGRCEQLAYQLSLLPGLFRRTKLIRVMPHFVILNCMEEDLEIRQKNSDPKGPPYTPILIPPYTTHPWHKSDQYSGTKVQFRSASSEWSCGCVDVNELGTSVLLLPQRGWFRGSANRGAVTAHVEVTLARACENAALIIVVWACPTAEGAAFSVKNDSDVAVSVIQSGSFQPPTLRGSGESSTVTDDNDPARYMVCVGPDMWLPFGWADPESPHEVSITVGTPPFHSQSPRVTINLLKLNQVTHLLVAENEEKKGKFLLGSWGGMRLGEKHASTPVGGSDGLSIKEVTDALKSKRATKSSDTDESEGDAVKAARARRRASRGPERGGEMGQKRERERERDMHSRDPSSLVPPVSQSIYIAVQQVGSGRVVRIVREESDLHRADLRGRDGTGSASGPTEEEDENTALLQGAQTGALIAGAAVGLVFLGPLAPVAVLGGAGVYAITRSVQASADRAQKDYEIMERMGRVASLASTSINDRSHPGNQRSSIKTVDRPIRSTKSLLSQSTDSDTDIDGSVGHAGGSGGEGVGSLDSMEPPAVSGVIISISLTFRIASIGVSLVVEQPIRREFLSLTVSEVTGKFCATSLSRSIEVVVGDLQLDSFSETASSPVLLYVVRTSASNSPADGGTEKEKGREKEKEKKKKNSRDRDLGQLAGDVDAKMSGDVGSGHLESALKFSLLQEYNPSSGTSHYRYIALRVLELVVSVDYASLQLLVLDLGADFSFVSREQQLAVKEPSQWADEFSLAVLSPERRLQVVDVYKSQLSARAPKILIENLVIHPMKITLSFIQSTLPRQQSNKNDAMAIAVGALSYIPVFANLDKVTLRLNSFIVEDAMESLPSLTTRVKAAVLRDLESQIARLAGSLSAIGRPVGLVRNIGGGVQAFFYEPYQGLIHGPQSFVIGIGKGAGSLVGGVVSGALTSAFAVVSTATQGVARGISYFGDEQFVQMRAEKYKRATDAAREGILPGFLEGGGSLVTGIASGVTGLFSRPIEGALKSGPSGFVIGIGLGVVGVAVSPMLGVTDGLNSVAQTIFIQSAEGCLRLPVRPARTLNCPEVLTPQPYPMVGSALVLPALDLNACKAQAAVLLMAKKRGQKDSFVGFLSLASSAKGTMNLEDSKHPAVILSSRYLILRALEEIIPQGPPPPTSNPLPLSQHGLFSWGGSSEWGLEVLPWTGISHFLSFGPYSYPRTSLQSENENENENENEDCSEEKGQSSATQPAVEVEVRESSRSGINMWTGSHPLLHPLVIPPGAKVEVDGDVEGEGDSDRQGDSSPTTQGLWGVVVVTSGGELAVHCPTQKCSLALCALLQSNVMRVKRPEMCILY